MSFFLSFVIFLSYCDIIILYYVIFYSIQFEIYFLVFQKKKRKKKIQRNFLVAIKQNKTKIKQKHKKQRFESQSNLNVKIYQEWILLSVCFRDIECINYHQYGDC